MNFTMDPITISFGILILAVLVLLGTVIYLHVKLKRFLIDKHAHTMSDSIGMMDISIKDLQAFRKELEEYLTTVEKRVRKSVQAVHTVRFNPFKGTGSGGNQSFATAFLNEDGDGVVVSSLYAREHVSIFSKPIKKGSSEFELSDEEKTAVTEAVKLIKNI